MILPLKTSFVLDYQNKPRFSTPAELVDPFKIHFLMILQSTLKTIKSFLMKIIYFCF